MSVITDIDFKILDFIHEHLSCKVLNFLMPKVTFIGNGGIIWILTAVIMLFSTKYRKTGITTGAGLFTGVIIGNVILKNLVARNRPCWINDTVNILISVPQDYSFPSGHTLSSFISATIIMHCNRRIGIIVYVVATMIAFSRLYLYVHFPLDVLAGVLIGIIIGTVSNIISDRIFSGINYYSTGIR